MNPTYEKYQAAQRPLTAIVDAAPSTAWDAPSPCEGWTARDVLRHVVATQREFLTGRGADLGPDPDVDADPAAAWRDHVARVTEAVADDALVTATYDGHFGPTTVGDTLVQFYGWDMVVHRWDLGQALGLDAGLTDGELDAVESGAEGFGDALTMDGVCKPPVDAPAGADRATRVMARLGRAA